MHPRLGAHLGQRMRDVVAVADVHELDALELAAVLADRQRVGHALAGVMRVREAVDHRDLAVLGEVLHVLLRERTDHDAVDVAAHHVGRVFDGLAHAQLDVVGVQEHRLRAELLDADLEAHARARAGLHEDHGHGAAGEHGVDLAAYLCGLQLGGEVEQRLDLNGREVVDGQEAAAGEVELGDAALDGLGHGTPSWRRLTAAVYRRAGGAWRGRRSGGGDRTHRALGPRRDHVLMPREAIR